MKRLITAVFLVCGLLTALTSAEEFRIESEIYVGKDRSPVSKTLTLFTGDVVYDFMENAPREVTVFDPRHDRIVLLNPARGEKTTVSLDALLQFTAAIKARLQQNAGGSAFDPEFERELDASKRTVSLTSPRIVYEARGVEPKIAAAVLEYRQFADWSARLNAMREGNLPPFARLKLNEALFELKTLPEEVKLTLHPQNRLTGKKLELRSRHTVVWTLSASDRRKIESVGQQLSTFQPVDFGTYRADALAAKGE